MTRLTKIEKETIVLFNEGEDKANTEHLLRLVDADHIIARLCEHQGR